ncbi:hypothetical protein [Nocardioides sp. YIM 152588]|uniref:hypothetical protein n=1 Tax=Nocardioides sp. YIM 152588 TaxID=3158259 RepID=UPI0032E487DA
MTDAPSSGSEGTPRDDSDAVDPDAVEPDTDQSAAAGASSADGPAEGAAPAEPLSPPTVTYPDTGGSSTTPPPPPPGPGGAQTVMVPTAADGQPEPPVGPGTAGGPDGPDAPGGEAAAPPAPPERAGITAALAAIGAGLLGAAVVVSAVRSRADGDLDWSVYGTGLAAVVALLAISLVGALLARRTAGAGARSDLVTWPGVVGIAGLGVLLPVGLQDTGVADHLAYLVGGVVAALGVVGYLLARRPAFAVVTVLGLGLVYAEAFGDIFGDSIDSEDAAVWFAIAVTAFVAIITVVGWLLPSRVITSVTVGVIGIVGIAGSLAAMLVMRLLGSALGQVMSEFGMSDDTGGMTSQVFGQPTWSAVPADYETDVAVVLGFAAGLTLLWALAAIITDHSGFSLLAIGMLATAIPLATVVLAVQHPTWWVAALGAGGAVVLLLAAPLVKRQAARVGTN